MKTDTRGAVWDLSSFFSIFDGPDMRAFKTTLGKEIADLVEDTLQVGTLSENTASCWEALILRGEDIGVRLEHLGAYLDCLAAADSQNEAYDRERAALSRLDAEFERYAIALKQSLLIPSEDRFRNFLSRQKILDIAHGLTRLRQLGRWMMSQASEVLAADLGVDGMKAWERLYDKISGTLTFTLTRPDGKRQRLPISRWRGLMADPDRRVGKAAWESGNRAWRKVENTCAAALNAISGSRLTLNRHRKVPHFLDTALFQAGIQTKTLEAMHEALYAMISLPRDIYRTKSAYFERKGIWFFEREAPLPIENLHRYSWKEATALIHEAFQIRYPALGDYFTRMLENKWVSSAPGKMRRPGAFCTGSELTREQRVYMTFTGTQGDLSTLAHEVGHAWHSHLLAAARPLARQYPMTLAETASTFCEQLLSESLLEKASTDHARLLKLDTDLSDAAILLLDISTRFDFEKKLYIQRQKCELSVSDLNYMMTESQRSTFGDALLEGGEDPLFWASKLHFYMTGISFYNFPYTFGFLLARVLAARLREEGGTFLRKYEAFLKASGSGPVETVVFDTFGMDVTRPVFWMNAIETLEAPLKEYKTLVERLREKGAR